MIRKIIAFFRKRRQIKAIVELMRDSEKLGLYNDERFYR